MGRDTIILNALDRVKRINEFKEAMRPFGEMLYRVYLYMPHPGYTLKEGILELNPPLPEWQNRIDEIKKECDKYIKDYFPEFYNEEYYGPF